MHPGIETPTELHVYSVTNGYTNHAYDEVSVTVAEDFTNGRVREAILKLGLPSGTYVVEYNTPVGYINWYVKLETITTSMIVE